MPVSPTDPPARPDRPAMSFPAPLLLAALLAAEPAAGPLDHHEKGEPKPDADGFVALFDGETLDGWTQQNGWATYRIEQMDGTPVIVGRTAPGSPNSFLRTAESYGDFILEYEVWLGNADGDKPYMNSGVQIRSNGKGEDADEDGFGDGRVNGPQIEIEAAPGDAAYIYSEGTGRGWLVPMDEHDTPDLFQNGEWNRFRVEARGDAIKTFLNGEPVADLTDPESPREGFIGLQVHSFGGPHPAEVRWRKLRIKPL